LTTDGDLGQYFDDHTFEIMIGSSGGKVAGSRVFRERKASEFGRILVNVDTGLGGLEAMKKIYLSIFLVLGVLVLSLPAFATDPVFTMRNPQAGQVLRGGSHITVTWDLTIDKSVLENPWAELELYLVDDHGLSLRATPQLNIRARSFDWVVPTINTRSARFILQFGIEGAGELSQLSQTGTFTIGTKAGPGIGIELPTQPVSAGSDLDIRWTSNLDTSYVYDVMISYDRGGHFFKAGTTTDTRYAFPVDEDFAGTITVRIVARGVDGSRVTSLLTPNAMIHTTDRD